MRTTISFIMNQYADDLDLFARNKVTVTREYADDPSAAVVADVFKDFLERMTYRVDAVDVQCGDYTHSSDDLRSSDDETDVSVAGI